MPIAQFEAGDLVRAVHKPGKIGRICEVVDYSGIHYYRIEFAPGVWSDYWERDLDHYSVFTRFLRLENKHD